MKKLLSILLAVAMMVSLALPAMAEESGEPTLSADANDMTYYVGGYGATLGHYQCQIRTEDGGWAERFEIAYGDSIVENWPTEAGTYTVTFEKTTAIEGAGDTEYTFNLSMNITVLELPATSGQCGDNMNWSFDTTTDTLTISGTGDMWSIAETYDDFSNSNFSFEPGWWELPVKHTVVSEGVENLSAYAFAGHWGAYETIQLPTTLKAIPNEGLLLSSAMKSLNIPEGVTELGGWLFGGPGNSFGDLDQLYLPSTLTKLDAATVILAGIAEGSKVETTPDFPTIYFAGTQEQWDAVELADTIHIAYGDSVMDNAYVDNFIKAIYGKTTAELFTEVTVVCTGKEEITVDNGTATVPDSAVEIAEGEDVVIDVTGTEEEVSSVVIGSETVDKIADAETAVEIKLPDATVSFDKTAIGSVSQQAGETAVTIVVKEVEDSTLTDQQKAALEEQEVHIILNLEAYAGETKITEFGGGKVTVSVPFELPEGKAGTDYYVAYVADDGTVTAMSTTYANGVLSFETTHFSSYVVLENVATNPGTGDIPQTGDSSAIMLFAVLMAVSAACLATCFAKRCAF